MSRAASKPAMAIATVVLLLLVLESAARMATRAYRAAGNDGAAEQVLRLERPLYSTHGGAPVFLDSEYDSIMRAVADEQGIELVDATEVLDADAENYMDYCHFNEYGHRQVARLLRDRIVSRKIAGR